MQNPATSEAAAFRWLVVILAGAVTVIAVNYAIGSLAAAIWALVLITVGLAWIIRAWRLSRHG